MSTLPNSIPPIEPPRQPTPGSGDFCLCAGAGMTPEQEKAGWVKVWRCLADSSIWSKPPLYVKTWLWLLGKATHTGNIKKRNLPLGTLTTTYSQMADALQWEDNRQPKIPDRKTLTRILEWLENERMITVETCPKRFTKINICNWSTYQSTDAELVSSERTTEGTLLKNVKKEEKEDTSAPTGRKRDLWWDQMAELWLEITGEKNTTGIFGKWRKSYGEEAPLQLAKDLVLKGRKLVREGKNTPEGYFVEALKNKQQDPRRNGQEHPASHPQPRPLLIAERSTLEPYIDPEERRHWIKEWYPDATTDPDQGYPFTLTDNYLAQPDTYISPLAKRFAKKGKEAGEKVAAV